jgi:phage terminase Nu1 subunit (DNA packaging protein)
VTLDELERATVTVGELADLVGLTPRRLQQLAAAGVSPRVAHGQYPLLPALHAYIEFLQAGIAREGSSSELTMQRARLASALADRLEMENAEMRRKYAPRRLIEQSIEAIGKKVAKILGGITPAVSARLPGLDPKVLALVAHEVGRAQQIAASARFPDIGAVVDHPSSFERKGRG